MQSKQEDVSLQINRILNCYNGKIWNGKDNDQDNDCLMFLKRLCERSNRF